MSKRLFPFVVLVFLAGQLAAAEVHVWFSPEGGCTAAVTNALARARRTVRVQAYSFTSEPIRMALVAAARRGVKVEVILDQGQLTATRSQGLELRRAGVPVYFDGQHAIAHNKVIIIDGRTVITGSFNFTAAAEKRNAENLVIIRGRQPALSYASNWHFHCKHSKP